MRGYVGAMFIYFAILAHGCDVREAANIQAKATTEAAATISRAIAEKR